MSPRIQGVVVDTSVFIDFLRGKPVPSFERLVSANEVLLSSFVRLELLQGARRSEIKLLSRLLEGLTAIPLAPTLASAAEELLSQIKGSGLNVGIVDLLIAAEAQALDCPLFSFDRVFQKLAAMNLVETWDVSAVIPL